MSETTGDYKVGIDFNPGKSDDVSYIKRMAADLIDAIDGIKVDINKNNASEIARLKALAMTEVEAGAMWAVKAITKRERT